MQLAFSFVALLATVFMTLSLAGDAAALPTARRDVGARMITLPLKRIHGARDDIHPQVLLQQHINRSVRRHARMTGRMEPSPRELAAQLSKRMADPLVARQMNKRFNRPAHPAADKANVDKQWAQKGATKTGKAGAAGAAAGESGNGTATSTAAAAQGSGSGIPEIDVQAAASGGLTEPENPTASNSVGLAIEANDVGYIATVQMGTPPADFKLLMDSGSADTWVGSENCTTEGTTQGCGTHNFLGPQSSSTFVNTGAQFETTYGTGQVQGDVIVDTLVLAGLSLTNHSFGVANFESTDFSSDTVPFDGLMGLAQSGISEQGVPTPVESLASAGLISEAITSFKLARLATPPNDGEVTFGGLDATKFNASTLVTFPNVNTEGFWEGSLDAVTANGQDLGLTGRTAILDTGTTLIVAPPNDAATVHAAIPGAQSDGQGGYTLPCTSTTSIALTFAGQAFAINPLDLLFAPVDANDLTGECVSGISSGEIGGATEWLVGDVFLKNAYFSVNQNKNEISLATLV